MTQHRRVLPVLLIGMVACVRPSPAIDPAIGGRSRSSVPSYLALRSGVAIEALTACVTAARKNAPEGGFEYELAADSNGDLVGVEVRGASQDVRTCIEEVFRFGLEVAEGGGLPIPGRFEARVVWTSRGVSIEAPGGNIAGAFTCLPDTQPSESDCDP
jgi:hypothetical protein